MGDVIFISTSCVKSIQNMMVAVFFLIRNDQNHDCKNSLRGAHYEHPGVIAINFDNHIFIADGDNEYDREKCWSTKKFKI